MSLENIDKSQEVVTSSGRSLTVNALMLAVGIAGTLGYNTITGNIEESPSYGNKSIVISDTTIAPAYPVVVPANTQMSVVRDSVGDSAGVNLIITPEHEQMMPPQTRLTYPSGRDNLKFMLPSGHHAVITMRIDGLLCGQIDFAPTQELLPNQVHGITLPVPALTTLDTTVTRW